MSILYPEHLQAAPSPPGGLVSAGGGVDGGLRDYPLFNIKVRLQHIGTVVLKAALVEGEARHAVTNLFVCLLRYELFML